MQRVDDKFATNARLAEAGLPVARSILVGRERIGRFDDRELDGEGLCLPLVVKPIRGRASHGVTVVREMAALIRDATTLIDSGRFGDRVMIEQFLEGEEVTVALVLSDGDPEHAWALPLDRRFDHLSDVASWNGDVPVSRNSIALAPDEEEDPEIRKIAGACIAAFAMLGARALMRIDCRRDHEGRFRLFDVNIKPKLTGAGRPGREEQDSLCAMAARAIGWGYADLLLATLRGAWRERGRG